ncbi:pyridoxamine 5'-phosphate oxidase family protein [Edaphobacter aggregans]|uniref:pyridoxamine 5'-phosphate oxidase family protein n=1 Tax=Edaphobacter aggregans TaxID=570835 RepID=UPI000A050335|nr:pyridoxamine 5'-phosphate oxidase family protein [Edaphobacter aggregans]
MSITFRRMRAIHVDGTPSEVDGLTAERVRCSIFRVLDGTMLGAWATVTSDGEAHVNTAYYSYSEDLVLHFMSHPHSLHCLNVSANSSMAVAIFASEQKWTDPGRGLQLFGRCDQLRGEDAAAAQRAYGQRFRTYADWKSSLKPGDAALDYRFYRFVPHTVKVLDEAEFGDGVWIEVQVAR